MSIAEQLYIDSLRQSQWLKPEAMVRYQRPLIERLVRHAATQTAFYSDRLAPLFHGSDPAAAPIDFARWSEVPIVTRVEATHQFDEMKAREVPPDAGPTRTGQSSGSTGRPLKHLRSEMADSAANCMLDRVYELFDMDLFGSLGFITSDREKLYPYPHGAKLKRWNRTAPDADLLVLDIDTSAADQLEWLERVRPDHVMTYPFNLRATAETALARGGSSHKFKTFVSTGESFDSEAHDLIVQAFGCRTIDLYAAREIGQIAFQCPDGPGYHLCSEAVLCELLDDDGLPVGPGEYGRVVVTSLYNFAMPFIRYDIGDYALAGMASCLCGRGLPSVDRIGGRTRSFFVMPDGSRKKPGGRALSDVSLYLSFKQVQFVQPDVNTLQIKYVPDDPAVPPRLADLTRMLREEFHGNLDVQLVPVDRIERGAGMKIDRFITLVT